MLLILGDNLVDESLQLHKALRRHNEKPSYFCILIHEVLLKKEELNLLLAHVPSKVVRELRRRYFVVDPLSGISDAFVLRNIGTGFRRVHVNR